MATAKENIQKLCKKKIEAGIFKLECCDAGQYKDIDEYNYFYIYNSFPENVLSEVKTNIEESIKKRNRRVHVLYLCPEHASVFNDSGNWRLVAKGSKLQLREGMHIYENAFC